MKRISLDRNWEYVEAALQNPLLVNMLQGWKKTDLPHDYSIEKGRDPHSPAGLDEGFFDGAGLYYKKTFLLQEAAAGKQAWLEFEGISGMTEVWVNKKFVVKHLNPYTSICVNVTDAVRLGENEIMVHTDSRMKPNSRWYVGAGIYRSVWLHIGEQTAVKPYGLRVSTKKLSAEEAILDISVELTGEAQPVHCVLKDADGNTAVFCNTAGQLRDTYLFFSKWLADLYSEQSRKFGIPDTIPNILMPPGTPCGGSAVWGDSATIVPWSAYQLSGDPEILRRQYGSMKDWVEWIRRSETADHLHKSGHQRGDWLAMDREEGKGNSGSTDPYLLSTAFYAHSTWILTQSAKILGFDADAEEYAALYEQIKAGFQAEYITPTGRLVSETQTACALVLCLGLAKPEHEGRILQTLADNLARHKGKLTTGFIGTPYLCQALSRFGRHDLAGKLLLNEEYPGWLNEVKLGATTIWERWDSMHQDGSFDESGMNSFNHYSFGAVGSWMLEHLAGLQHTKPGYKEIQIRPQFVQGITQVRAWRKTPYGLLSCGWKCKSGQITVDVEIPVNTTAALWLPEQDGPITLGSGRYHYAYPTATCLEPQKYTMDTTIGALVGNPIFANEVEKLMPGASQNMHMEFLQKKTLGEMMTMMPAGASSAFQGILNKLNEEEP